MHRGLLTILGSLLIASAVSAKPTREEIVAFHKKCRDEFINIDLIARFGADYRGLDLSGIDLRGEGRNGQWINTNWSGADLRGANLELAILTGVKLTGARLDGIKAKGVSLGQAELTGANLDDADLRDAHLDFIKLINGSARRADMSGAEISAAQFAHSDLSGASLNNVHCLWYPPHFPGAILADADLRNARLLPGADFQNADLSRANFRKARLIQADFRRANLDKTDLAETDVDAARFDGATGLSPAELADLEAAAARWKYELRVLGEELLHLAHVIAFFLAPTVALALGFRMRRRVDAGASDGSFADRSVAEAQSGTVAAHPRQRWLGNTILSLNGFALLARLVLFLFSFIGSPVAQFNVGNNAAMSAWSLWIRMWPLLMLGLGLGFCAAAGLTLFCLAHIWFDRKAWLQPLIASIFTLVHVGLQYYYIGRFFPTA